MDFEISCAVKIFKVAQPSVGRVQVLGSVIGMVRVTSTNSSRLSGCLLPFRPSLRIPQLGILMLRERESSDHGGGVLCPGCPQSVVSYLWG